MPINFGKVLLAASLICLFAAAAVMSGIEITFGVRIIGIVIFWFCYRLLKARLFGQDVSESNQNCAEANPAEVREQMRAQVKVQKNMRAREHTNQGFKYYQEGNLDQAIITFKEVLKLKPDYMPAYSALAVCYKEKRRFKEAVKMLERFLFLYQDPAVLEEMRLSRASRVKSIAGLDIGSNEVEMVEMTQTMIREIKAELGRKL